MSANPDEIVDYRPERCGDCGNAFHLADDEGFTDAIAEKQAS